MSAALEVRGLSVELTTEGGPIRPVRDVSFAVAEGEIVGIAGESGSGKTLTSLAIAQLLPRQASASAESLQLGGRELRGMRRRQRDDYLGSRLAMVFQDPMSSLNPARRVGSQMVEAVRAHRGLGRRDALALAERRLGEMRIPDPHRRLRQYPHEFSGGMRQRAMLAMGLMTEPMLLIADEPTTALDVTVQAQVMDLIMELNSRHGTAVLLVSHNIALLSEICDRVLVMYGGTVVEDLPIDRLQDGAAHPYTRALVEAVPDMTADRSRPLLSIEGSPVTPAERPQGCPFAPRCPLAVDRCRQQEPPLAEQEPGHRLACWVTGHGSSRGE